MAVLRYSLKLNKVRVEEINFKEPDEDFIKTFSEEFLNIVVAIDFSYHQDNKSIVLYLNVTYDYGEEPAPALKLLDFKGSFEFFVEHINGVADQSITEVVLPDAILENITEVAYSSARGIIIAKTAGSFINKFYLPIISPEEILMTVLGKDEVSGSLEYTDKSDS